MGGKRGTTVGALILLCVLMGGALADGATPTDHWFVRTTLVGIPLLTIGVLLITELGPRALPIWVAASPIAYPFLRYPLHSGGYVTFDRVWILGLLVILLRLPRPASTDPASRLLRNALMLFAALYAVRLLLIPPYGSLTEVRYFVDAFVLPIIVYLTTKRIVYWNGDDRIIRALVISGILISVISIAELILGFSLAGFSGGTSVFDAAAGVQRVSGPYSSNASSSTAALVCLAASVYWTRRCSGGARTAGMIATAIIAAGALASFHRAAGIAVIAILILATVPGARNQGARYATIVMFGLLAAVAFYAASGAVEHSKFYQGRISSNANVLGRFASWDQSIAIFRTSPLIGVGPGQAPIIQQQQGLFKVAGVSAAVTIHNSFLTVLAENGIIGVMAFLFLCGAVIKIVMALRAVRRSTKIQLLYGSVLGASVGYLVMSLTLTILLEAPAAQLFAVLLGVAAGQLDRAHATSELIDSASVRGYHKPSWPVTGGRGVHEPEPVTASSVRVLEHGTVGKG